MGDSDLNRPFSQDTVARCLVLASQGRMQGEWPCRCFKTDYGDWSGFECIGDSSEIRADTPDTEIDGVLMRWVRKCGEFGSDRLEIMLR